MERFPVELLYVLAIVGFFLFSVLAQRAARRRQQEEAAKAPVEPPPGEDQPLEDAWGRTAVPTPPPAPRAAPPPARIGPPPPRRLHPVRALLNDKQDLRRVVVLMMVLGPCRAQEPPEER